MFRVGEEDIQEAFLEEMALEPGHKVWVMLDLRVDGQEFQAEVPERAKVRQTSSHPLCFPEMVLGQGGWGDIAPLLISSPHSAPGLHSRSW